MEEYARLHQNTIEIVVEFDPIRCRNNLRGDNQYSEDQLQWYNDLIENVLNVIEDYAGFNIIQSYQSSESYSYYIEFEAFKEDGTELGTFTIKLRISDHIQKHYARNKRPASEAVQKHNLTIFRSIRVNNKTRSGMFDTVQVIQHVCDELLKGNTDVLDQI